MADIEVATKAPENDAVEGTRSSLVPGDTPVQSGATMGLGVSWCFRDSS
jgi:hypothetical protein